MPKRIIVAHYGGPETLQVVEEECAEPKRRMIPYSIQWRKRLNPAPFREDLIALLDLLRQQKIKPLISQRFPLVEARQAHELLGRGGVIGKIVLVPKLNVAIQN
jgi:D-arabinose 1-dehydrogenase-like Zn-dependent alcohol dehydrogenase